MNGKTVPVDKYKYENYLKKAEQYARSMSDAFSRNDWDSCVGNAIHSAISAGDALCIFTLGLRHKGERHEDVINIFMSIDPGNEGIRKNAQRLGSLLSIKTDVEYTERLMTQTDAEMAIKAVQRFLDFVKEKIKEKL